MTNLMCYLIIRSFLYVCQCQSRDILKRQIIDYNPRDNDYAELKDQFDKLTSWHLEVNIVTRGNTTSSRIRITYYNKR